MFIVYLIIYKPWISGPTTECQWICMKPSECVWMIPGTELDA